MSYWSQNAAPSSAFDDLLSNDDVTLQEILEEAEVIQECRSQNKKLIDFLIRPDILRELIVLTTRVPADENGETVRYKYPNIACELLTSELPLIIETIASDHQLLDELYAFLESDPPLNPLLASFFSRIMGVLVAKTSEQNWFSYQVSCLRVLEYLKSKGNFIALLLRHLGTSAILDLILKMYSKIEGFDVRNNYFLLWLEEEEFLDQLISQLTPHAHSDIQTNVCQLLTDFIVCSRDDGVVKTGNNHELDNIIQEIESEKYITKVLEQMLMEPRCERSIVGGIAVVLTILGVHRREEYACSSWDMFTNASTTSRENTIAAIKPFLPHMLDLLQNPPPKPCVRTTVGIIEPPLGATRVEIVRLISALVNTGVEDLLAEIERINLLNVTLDLFFQYHWNNFLHAQVEATLVAALKHLSIAKHIFLDCKIIQRIIRACDDNAAQEREGKPRRGYMGHVIRISNHLVEECSCAPLDAVLLEALTADERAAWTWLVDGYLAKVNGDQISGIPFQNKRRVSGDNEQYYTEELGNTFADNFCDEQQLGSQDSNMADSGIRALKPGFPDADSEDVLAKQSELFQQLCSQRLQTLDDDSDMWSSIIKNETQIARVWREDENSDEEGGPGLDDDWEDKVRSVAPVEQSNPWSADALTAASPPDPGWANFESSPFIANFDYNLSSTIATSAPGDSEPVSFDLTPTEVPAFPANDDDWATGGQPPSDWLISPPSETAKDYVEKAASDSAPCDLSQQLASTIADRPNCEILANEAVPDSTEIPQGNIAMEMAQIIESENSADIVVASDFKSRNDDGSNVVDDSKVVGAVIVKAAESSEVATQLAQLLAEVSITASSPPNAHGDPSVISNSAEESPDDMPSVNNDVNVEDDAALVPKMTSNIAVNEDVEKLNPPSGIAPNDVTAI